MITGTRKINRKERKMNSYRKISPFLMMIGFLMLAGGVFLSMSAAYKTAAYIIVGLGLITYIVGRVGVYFSTKNNASTTQEEKESI
jgi:uncharacterized membrane protein